ncbi:MAG: hypothetical protein KDA88_22160 [Planctomycetaceae bacterium]|nr:hypothetical protein [Planctomycetaceae bacterium]MCB9949652.1 hypothetical protein [Planctomycetaceae bacterium]
MKVYFSDWFDVDPEAIEEYGAFNVSLINDLPLFIDPFLLFTSEKEEYQFLHDEIIKYLTFLRDQSVDGNVDEGLLKSWYMFPEVKQLWLGFSQSGNNGSGLGIDFARALNSNLHVIFTNFGDEKVSKGSHIEKVCLVREGVGRDNISDFTANLIKEYLLEYTQTFAQAHINETNRKTVPVANVRFDYEKRYWCPKSFDLPHVRGDFVLLAPKDILTKDENWINRNDLMDRFETIVSSTDDLQLRSQVSQYLERAIDKRSKQAERRRAYDVLLKKYPQLIEWYIKYKEDTGGQAKAVSSEKVTASEEFYIDQFGQLITQLEVETEFYKRGIDTLQECRERLLFLKSEIENNGAFRLFYHNGQPIQRESDLQILFRLTWYATPSDFNAEVNNGRGPVDFKVSRGNKDKTLVEFKLAKNSKLQQNLEKQVPIYEAANRTKRSLKAIFYFTEEERQKVQRVLKELKLEADESIILIDCRRDNKPSASNA